MAPGAMRGHLFGHGSRLNAMHRFLDFRIEILDSQRCAIESRLAQSDDVLACEAARVDFDASFNIFRELEMAVNDLNQPADLVRGKKSGGGSPPMKLNDPPP